jgi:CO/xanthine dehydrogenase FAD-binding subunit
MDLNTIEELVTGAEPADFRPGDAWLAGGTWLFSEPQPGLRRLLDLPSLGWPALRVSPSGLTIAATCTIAELYAFEPPPQWPVRDLIRQCCESFLASFKVWNLATVGGNLCNALPAGPMISLTAALNGTCEILTPSGVLDSSPAAQFVIGDNRNRLAPGDLLRSITLPDQALRARTAFRRESLTTLGRSAALLIGLLDGPDLILTITASTKSPVQLKFSGFPTAVELRTAIATEIPFELYHDDIHGLPAWREHLTYALAEEIRQELGS